MVIFNNFAKCINNFPLIVFIIQLIASLGQHSIPSPTINKNQNNVNQSNANQSAQSYGTENTYNVNPYNHVNVHNIDETENSENYDDDSEDENDNYSIQALYNQNSNAQSLTIDRIRDIRDVRGGGGGGTEMDDDNQVVAEMIVQNRTRGNSDLNTNPNVDKQESFAL